MTENKSLLKPNNFYDFLVQRKSDSRLSGAVPSEDVIKKLLAAALTVPDHGGLRPYRFVVATTNPSKNEFADGLVEQANLLREQPLDEAVERKIRAKAFLAPLQIFCVFSPVESEKIPQWEQFATASCCGYAISLAAHALGFQTIWKSFSYGVGPKLQAFLQIEEGEKWLGWINIGQVKEPLNRERKDPPVDAYVVFNP